MSRNLIIVEAGGHRYGLYKDEVLQTGAVGPIHMLPMTPRHFAGVGEFSDRTVSLYDLGKCLGHDSYDRTSTGQALIMDEERSLKGFVCTAIHNEVQVSETYTVAPYLKCPLITHCVVVDSELLPVVEMKVLYSMVTTSKWVLPMFELVGLENMVQQDTGELRLFRAGGQTFALPAGEFQQEVHSPESILPLALMPDFVEGIFIDSGKIFASFNMAIHMGLHKGKGGGELLKSDHYQLSVHIDSDMGVVTPDGHADNITALPPLARLRTMQDALISDGQVVPVVLEQQLIASGDELPFDERYSHDKGILDKFQKEDIEVVEISLLSGTMAISGSEVLDVIPWRPYRPVPGVHSIMLGVIEHQGEALPVLDLALCFGYRSKVSESWKMVLISNNDFRAFVLTESASEKELLSVDRHKPLPMGQDHRYIYGCYTDGDNVRLIINVKALTIYYDEATVAKIFESISAELADSSQDGFEKESEARAREEELARLLAEKERLEKSEAERLAHEDALQKEQELKAANLKAMQDAELKAQQDAELKAQQEADEKAQQDAELKAQQEAELKAQQEADEKAQQDAELRAQQDAELRAQQEAELKAQQDAELKAQQEADEKAKKELLKLVESKKQQTTAARKLRSKKSLIPYLLLLLLLLLCTGFVLKVYILDTEQKTVATVSAPEPEPVPEPTPEPEPEPEPEPTPEPEPSIVIEIEPVSQEQVVVVYSPEVVEEKVYYVKRGDTLWHISKRFLGTPWKYPGIAKYNKIRNPDLIYPKQKIIVRPSRKD